MALQKSLLPVAQDSTQTLPPAGVRDLTNTDIQRIQASLDHSVSDNTRKMYASAWRAFQSWTRARGILALPASTSLIAAYLAHLAAVHKAAGREDPTDNEGVRRVMQGIPRTHDRVQRQAKPLTAEGPGRCQGHRKEPALPGHRWKTPGIG